MPFRLGTLRRVKRLQSISFRSSRALLSLARDSLAAQPDVFPTSDKAHATARSTSGQAWRVSIQPSAERLDKPYVRQGRLARGCAGFASASFAKPHRSRAGAPRNALSFSTATG